MRKNERALEQDALSVQAKCIVLVAEIPEAGSRPAFIKELRPARTHLGGDLIHCRIFQAPKPPVGDREVRLHLRVAGGQFDVHLRGVGGLSLLGRGDGKACGGLHRILSGIAHVRLDADAPGFPIRLEVDVLNAHNRRGQHLHGIRDAAGIVNAARLHRIGPGTAGGRVQRDAVDRLVGRIQHAHGQAVFAVGFDGGRDVKFKWILRAFVGADPLTVEPDLRKVIDPEEPQDGAPVGVGIRRRGEVAPIPCHPVVVVEDVLDNPRDLCGFRVLRRLVEPPLFAPHVFRVGRDEPIRAIQRSHHGGLRAERRLRRTPRGRSLLRCAAEHGE